MQSLVKLAG